MKTKKKSPRRGRCIDNGGRRVGIERRQFEYTGHAPERRGQTVRRSGSDRRKGPRSGLKPCDGH